MIAHIPPLCQRPSTVRRTKTECIVGTRTYSISHTTDADELLVEDELKAFRNRCKHVTTFDSILRFGGFAIGDDGQGKSGVCHCLLTI